MSENLQERVKRLRAAGFYPDQTAFRVICGEKNEGPQDQIFIVAVVGQICDWAAYRGQPGWGLAKAKSNGDKISEQLARELFPEFGPLEYRP